MFVRYLCLTFLLCILANSCTQQQPTNSKSNPKATKVTPKSDTILFTFKQLYIEYWADTARKVDFSATWVEKALAYRKDTLPTSLTKYLSPIFKMPCMQEKLYFDSWTWNLDDDVEEERLLFFFNSCWVSNDVLIIVLEKEENGWQVGTAFRGLSRYSLQEMMPTFDAERKVLFLRNGVWGSAMDWLDIRLLKKIGSRYKGIGKIEQAKSFFATNPSFAGVTIRSRADYQFTDATHIKVTHYFSIMKDMAQKPDFMLIKDRPLEEILEWSKEKKQFISLLTPEQRNVFMDSLEKELANLAQNGTPEQREHLAFFLEGYLIRNKQ